MQAAIRSALFVPATRPERIAKALTSGADAVIVDLEDAVEATAKETARANLLAFITEHPDTSLWVRVNDATSPWFIDDLDVARKLPKGSAVLLPKAESAAQVSAVAQTRHSVIAQIESARGIIALPEIVATSGVVRLCFGSLDFGLDVGLNPDTPGAASVLDQARFQILLHSTAANLAAPIDTVFSAIHDTDGLARVASRACEMGFGGMLCIHPTQIAVVHAAFAPGDQDLAWARRIVAAAQESAEGVFCLAGEMVDAPVINRARQILARSASH